MELYGLFSLVSLSNMFLRVIHVGDSPTLWSLPPSLSLAQPCLCSFLLSLSLSLTPFSFQASTLLRPLPLPLLEQPPLPHSPIVLTVAKCWDPSPQAYFTLPRSE